MVFWKSRRFLANRNCASYQKPLNYMCVCVCFICFIIIYLFIFSIGIADPRIFITNRIYKLQYFMNKVHSVLDVVNLHTQKKWMDLKWSQEMTMLHCSDAEIQQLCHSYCLILDSNYTALCPKNFDKIKSS